MTNFVLKFRVSVSKVKIIRLGTYNKSHEVTKSILLTS